MELPEQEGNDGLMWTGGQACRLSVHFSRTKNPGKSTLSGFWWTSGQLDSVYHEGHTKRNQAGQETCLRPQKNRMESSESGKAPFFFPAGEKGLFCFRIHGRKKGISPFFRPLQTPVYLFHLLLQGACLRPPAKRKRWHLCSFRAPRYSCWSG